MQKSTSVSTVSVLSKNMGEKYLGSYNQVFNNLYLGFRF